MKKLNRLKRILKYTPRVLSIIYILFISIFALDMFGNGYSFLQLMIGLFMHLLPSFALIIALVIAWKREFIGGIIFLVIGLSFTVLFMTYKSILTFVFLSLPPLIIGGLYLLSSYLSKNKK